MTDPDTRVHDVKTRIAAAVRVRARLEHDRATANAQVHTLLDQLAHEFGVTSLDDARRVHADLRARLDDTLTALAAAVTDIHV